jgi:hypothetical protein
MLKGVASVAVQAHVPFPPYSHTVITIFSLTFFAPSLRLCAFAVNRDLTHGLSPPPLKYDQSPDAGMDIAGIGRKQLLFKFGDLGIIKDPLLQNEFFRKEVVGNGRPHFAPEPFQQRYFKAFLRTVIQFRRKKIAEAIL